jgi:hypothetical protein
VLTSNCARIRRTLQRGRAEPQGVKAMTGVRRRCPQDTTRNPVLPTVPLDLRVYTSASHSRLTLGRSTAWTLPSQRLQFPLLASRQWLALELRIAAA